MALDGYMDRGWSGDSDFLAVRDEWTWTTFTMIRLAEGDMVI